MITYSEASFSKICGRVGNYFVIRFLLFVALLCDCAGAVNSTFSESGGGYIATKDGVNCSVLIFALFRDCSANLYNPTENASVTEACCGLAWQANGGNCYCDGTQVEAATFLGLPPAAIEQGLVDKCKVPINDIKIFGVRGCNEKTKDRSAEQSGGSIAWPIIGGVAGAVVAAGLALGILLKKRKLWRSQMAEAFEGLTVYPYARLEAATARFQHLLGEGASAVVYRAELDGRTVAVKRLKMESSDMGNSAQIATRIFSNEAKGLGRLQHRNLVQLLGYSAEVGRPHMLVYEFVPGGALDAMLYDNHGVQGFQRHIPFEHRIAIALGIARGVEYCHHSIQSPVVHRDLKPANILMTSYGRDGVPKIADFGLARIVDAGREATREFLPASLPHSSSLSVDEALDIFPPPNRSHMRASTDSTLSVFQPHVGASDRSTESAEAVPSPSCASSDLSTARNRMMVSESYPSGLETTVVGTFGYIDPEYRNTGQPTLKSDVYSFGIMLLELVLGRPPSIILEMLAGRSLVTGSGQFMHVSMADCLQALLAQGEEAVVVRVREWTGERDAPQRPCFQALSIASVCIQDRGKQRPSMRGVVRMLEMLTGALMDVDEAIGDDKLVVTVL